MQFVNPHLERTQRLDENRKLVQALHNIQPAIDNKEPQRYPHLSDNKKREWLLDSEQPAFAYRRLACQRDRAALQTAAQHSTFGCCAYNLQRQAKCCCACQSCRVGLSAAMQTGGGLCAHHRQRFSLAAMDTVWGSKPSRTAC